LYLLFFRPETRQQALHILYSFAISGNHKPCPIAAKDRHLNYVGPSWLAMRRSIPNEALCICSFPSFITTRGAEFLKVEILVQREISKHDADLILIW
jgi:hypothetical protein